MSEVVVVGGEGVDEESKQGVRETCVEISA